MVVVIPIVQRFVDFLFQQVGSQSANFCGVADRQRGILFCKVVMTKTHIDQGHQYLGTQLQHESRVRPFNRI